ncbi:dihydrodipicolinate synthase family protein [Roseomonas alkaliterrae]|uniref:4-hydroxy-tetrahydrodipicolinate synthase n=1 Tax=Neoroseomonas alkaliterrae TaxID=1452450 RepID=A0A840XQD0_9PROT|nr:dihydrodipicolinate synthase family protein [Neoroseomonas alkaliterrae]MBB5689060.1 4-hydroxy-tetrahydrodipicolinate synthase [Neoroseomonas alkaliterrae]MBR0674605.1 dihydrodipicolinate synthase family protein [Neoroseomonas alkaliterrae]
MIALHPRGVFCAALTPVTEALAPDHALFVAHCRRLLAEGCDGVALLGTTGEANSFSSDERRGLLEAVVAAGIAPDRLLPGTGVPALTETVALTRHALSLGVTTVVMLPPFYYKGVTEDGLFAAYAEVVERVADPRLRIVLYHIPQMSAVPIPFPVIARLRATYPGIFTGIKDSAGDLAHMEELVATFPGLAVLAGADPLMLPLLKAGGAGCITATSNLVAGDLAFVFRHHADAALTAEVEAAQARIVAARDRASRFAQIASLKLLLADRTGQPGWHRLRPPLLPLNQAEADALRAA